MTTPTDLHRALAEVAQEASAEYSRRNKMRTKEGRREVIAQALAEKMPGWRPIAEIEKAYPAGTMVWATDGKARWVDRIFPGFACRWSHYTATHAIPFPDLPPPPESP